MPKYKSVYFAPDGTWFEDREECQEYEDKQALINWIIDTSSGGLDRKDVEWIASKLLERYNIEQKWNWKKPEEPKTLAQTIISTLKEDASNGFYDNEPAPKVEPESK